ncbi:YeeE/YedE family protein [Salinibacter sp. 10B]|uniref:YeeE/YedE family protein n=1 Tax=Salinibacter sp. 10B TaxID=1923971 RepID=UPI000CF4878C|nr:YeeE/YedE thiosulfate transporter family protein [Salinibacter sp. 10B]PQJ34310.1 YeeE/YedE family protein [Salinibacter sp. 10B]
MSGLLSASWPWYVAGPIIGLFVPLLLFLTGKAFGVSSSLKHACAATVPGRADYFNYDWKASGLWNLIFVVGILLGGVVAVQFLGGGGPTGISAATKTDLQALGLTDFSGLVPPELFSWSSLTTLPGLVAIVLGGFLVGFGARYAGGCTSGHAITGMATMQLPSLIAVVGFFIGGLFTTYVLLPLLLG